jgi:hypothetical protein
MVEKYRVLYRKTDETIKGKGKVLDMILYQARIYHADNSYIYLTPYALPIGYLSRYIMYAMFELPSDRNYVTIERLMEIIKANLDRYLKLYVKTYQLKQEARLASDGVNCKHSIFEITKFAKPKNIHRATVVTTLWKLCPVLLHIQQKSQALVQIRLSPTGIALKRQFQRLNMLF